MEGAYSYRDCDAARHAKALLQHGAAVMAFDERAWTPQRRVISIINQYPKLLKVIEDEIDCILRGTPNGAKP